MSAPHDRLKGRSQNPDSAKLANRDHPLRGGGWGEGTL